jgi:hydrogenase maturation protease
MHTIEDRDSRILVLGIGNTLLSDEGVGVHVIDRLSRDALPERVTCLDGGTLSFTLAGPIEDCDQLIVVDAAELSSQPGTVHVFEGEAMDDYVAKGGKRSVHEVGLADLLSIAALAGHLPARRALVGIQPELLDWGNDCTPTVAAAIPQACERVHTLISRWAT